MLPLEVRLAEFEFHRRELAFEYLHDEVAAAARGLQKAGVNALGFALHQVQHGLDHPCRREYLAVVSYALFGLDEVHAAPQRVAAGQDGEIEVGFFMAIEFLWIALVLCGTGGKLTARKRPFCETNLRLKQFVQKTQLAANVM
jgi:hypothetical protein